MVRKILYFLVLVVTAYLEIMYDTTWMLTLLSFEVTLAAAMLVLSLYFYRNVRVFLKTKAGFAAKGEDILLEIHVENRSWLPVCGVLISVGYGTVYTEQTEYRIVREHVPARSHKKIVVSARSEYGGCMRFFIKKVKVGDYLHLFRRTVRRKDASEAWVDVLPDMLNMPVEVTSRTRNFQVESSEYETDRGGDDPSEVFQIREYRGGDRVRQIHWKMSARTGNLMAKEYSMPKGCKVLLLFENTGRCEDPGMADLFFEIAASVSHSLMAAECMHCAVWYDPAGEEIARRVIRTEEDVYEAVSRLMSARPGESDMDLEDAYRFANPQENYSTVLCVDMQGGLKCNGCVMGQFEKDHLKQQLAGCLLEV